MGLLWSRVPVEDARASGKLTASQIRALDAIADVRAFGSEIGLSATDNYTAIALEWDRTIWNVSGCQPERFEPKTWWFPIVGRVPYKGYIDKGDAREQRGGEIRRVRTRLVIGADGARSAVAAQNIAGAERMKCVFAYHEIIQSPANDSDHFDASRCDVFYQGRLSPDFYAWVFPHGETASVGVGSANKGFSLRGAVARMRGDLELDGCETIRRPVARGSITR